jgi:AcrR family transcriptional regulator
MARPLQPEKRQRHLEGTVDYVLRHGLAGLSLRPLAEALATSPRLLLYHFGSKEALVASALDAARARMILQLDLGTRRGSFSAWWQELSRPEIQPYWRLILEVYALGLQGEGVYADMLRRAIADWITALPVVDQDVATLMVAVVGGLLLDLMGTGDRARVDGAAARFDQLISKKERP